MQKIANGLIIVIIAGGGWMLTVGVVGVRVVQKIRQDTGVIDVCRVLNVINLKWVIFALIRQSVFKI
jgi:hypothetical protein